MQTGETGDCSAALAYWGKAFTYFNEIPPVYTSDNAVSYAHARNRSFVALYNPRSGAKLDCAYFICPLPSDASTHSTTTEETRNSTNSGHEGNTQELYGRERKVLSHPGFHHSEGSEHMNGHGRADDSKHPKGEMHDNFLTRRLESHATDIRALVCLTNPRALVPGRRPFS